MRFPNKKLKKAYELMREKEFTQKTVQHTLHEVNGDTIIPRAEADWLIDNGYVSRSFNGSCSIFKLK